MKFAANKQVDNLYYVFFSFDLGTWKILLTAMISSSKIFWPWRTCFPQLGSDPTFFFYFYTFNYLWVFYWGWVEVKGQPMGVGFFFPSCSWGLISGCQAWQQVSLPTKLSCWPKESTIFFPGQDTCLKFLLLILTESNHDLSFKFSSFPVLDGKEEKQHNLEKEYRSKKQQPLINIPWCCYVPHGYTRSNCLAIRLADAGFSWKADGGGWLSSSSCDFAWLEVQGQGQKAVARCLPGKDLSLASFIPMEADSVIVFFVLHMYA